MLFRSALPSGETVLMTAARGGNAAVVERLLKAGAAVDAAQTSKGQTALMWAATGQNVAVAKLTTGDQVCLRNQVVTVVISLGFLSHAHQHIQVRFPGALDLGSKGLERLA